MKRLTDARSIYRALSHLLPGDAVPTEVYILDECDGTIPLWVVVYRKELGAGGVALIVEDQTPRMMQANLWEPEITVRRSIMTFSTRTLASQVYGQEGEPEWCAPNQKMCSLVQQAKHFGHLGKERKAA